MANKSRAEVVDAFNAAGMPTGPVYTAEDVFADDHFRVRGMLAEIEDPEVGTYTFARSVPHLSAAPTIPVNPAPAMGADTREILQGILEYSAEEVEELVSDGVVEVPE